MFPASDDGRFGTEIPGAQIEKRTELHRDEPVEGKIRLDIKKIRPPKLEGILQYHPPITVLSIQFLLHNIRPGVVRFFSVYL